MTEEQQERAAILMQATYEILRKCDEGMYVKNVMEVTTVWDEAECDGNCLMEELEGLLNEIKQ